MCLKSLNSDIVNSVFLCFISCSTLGEVVFLLLVKLLQDSHHLVFFYSLDIVDNDPTSFLKVLILLQLIKLPFDIEACLVW